MVFFVAQAVAAAVIIGRGRVTGAAVLIAFSIGGAVTYVLMRWVYASAKTEGVPRILGEGANRPLLGIVAGSRPARPACSIYSASMRSICSRSARAREQATRRSDCGCCRWRSSRRRMFEEFIFRGLIFGGLRRSFGVWPATLASAAIFAIVHPPFSIIPVFILGVCAALVYERSRSLLAPMLVHAVYNALRDRRADVPALRKSHPGL